MPHGFPALASCRLDRAQVEHLARVVPLINCGGGVEAFVALQANERCLE